MLNAGITPIFNSQYFKRDPRERIGYNNNTIFVKKPITGSQPAGIRNKSHFEVSQRLHAGDLIYPYLVGLIEGDGWFSITKKGDYLLYEFGIELELQDVQLLYKLKDVLGVGTLFFRTTETRSKTAIFRVRNKYDLINVILPIFDKYPLISNKQYDYIRFKNALLMNIKYYKDLTEYTRPKIDLNSRDSILNLPYFGPWLIGFIEAEGCFSIYKPHNSKSHVASFDITQTEGEELIWAIRKHLSFSPNVTRDKTNNYKIKVSGVRSIENLIKFMHNASIQLLGKKRLQYLLWLKQLRTIKRYRDKITIPDNY